MPFNLRKSNRFTGAYSVPRVHPESVTPHPTTSTSDSPPEASPQADLLYCTDIEHHEVEWLWQDRLALGSLAVLSGDPGAGKTWVALAIAAALSRGQSPGEIDPTEDDTVPPCTTIYATAGYLGSQLIRPRFSSLSGDPARLVLLRGTTSSAFSLHDTPILEDALRRTGARLLIIDPLHSYLAAGTRHRAHEGARVFDNLAHLAEKHSCCILLVRHLRRRGRGSASVELSGAVRSEFLVGSSPDAPGFSAIVQTKSNLGPLAPSLGYLLSPESDLAFHWTGPSALTPENLQTDRPIGAGLPQRKFAAEWLRRQLAKGPLSRGTVEVAADRDGLSIKTVRRAKLDIGIVSYKNSFDGAWYWELLEGYGSADEFLSAETAAGRDNKQ